MKKAKPIKINYKSLPGISEKQISEHLDILYKGYVDKLNVIREKLVGCDPDQANPTYGELRELKMEESFALNAVRLHEAYFRVMGGKGKATKYIGEIITDNFGSYENFVDLFVASGLSARGWCILYYDQEDRDLKIGISDWHSHGGIWKGVPLLVLDVYEHAYFLDYGTARKAYIKQFMANIDWSYAEEKLREVIK